MTPIALKEDIFASGIATWAKRVREGEISFEQTTHHCFERIASESQLDAFECLDHDRALLQSQALDNLLQSGRDLGVLMGLPVGVKDIMAAEGLPTTNGSNASTADLTGSEGEVVSRLKKAGAVVVGKTRTVEFALGATGINESRGTPWNPVDRNIHRMPGGSSSGSAVATAAGLIGLGLGTDTGGSIRIPACMTGITGHKTTVGRWPLSGVFSLSTSLDSMGPICRNVNDSILLHQFITGETVEARRSVNGLRLGIVEDLFMEDLDKKVAGDFERSCKLLESQGAELVTIKFPEVCERVPLFTAIVPAELIANLTPDRFSEIRAGVDPVTAERAAVGLTATAQAYVSAQRRRAELVAKANSTFRDVDAWVSPTCPFLPLSLSEMQTPEGHERALLASRNTQPGNLLNMCGLSIPMHTDGLPTGFQMTLPGGHDAQLLAMGLAVEKCLRS